MLKFIAQWLSTVSAGCLVTALFIKNEQLQAIGSGSGVLLFILAVIVFWKGDKKTNFCIIRKEDENEK